MSPSTYTTIRHTTPLTKPPEEFDADPSPPKHDAQHTYIATAKHPNHNANNQMCAGLRYGPTSTGGCSPDSPRSDRMGTACVRKGGSVYLSTHPFQSSVYVDRATPERVGRHAPSATAVHRRRSYMHTALRSRCRCFCFRRQFRWIWAVACNKHENQ